MAKTWPSGASPGPGNNFWAKILKRESIPSNKQIIWYQSQPPRTTPVPEMAKTWPSGTFSGPGNDFWAKILKKELTPGEKQMIWCQSQPPRTGPHGVRGGRKWVQNDPDNFLLYPCVMKKCSKVHPLGWGWPYSSPGCISGGHHRPDNFFSFSTPVNLPEHEESGQGHVSVLVNLTFDLVAQWHLYLPSFW